MGKNEPVRRVISWDEYDELCSHIAAQIGDNVPDVIVGLTRGGLVPAVRLSHIFNVKLYTLNISLRDGKCSSARFDWRRIEKYRNILIVDDINDSGNTLFEVSNQFYGREIRKPNFAALLSKSSSKFECDYSGELINKDKDNDWIVFPWE
jgi:hypoxanthine phosphoribosyltransferase